MTAKEAIEKFYEETIKTIRGAEEQKFNGEELFKILEELTEETKEKILKEIKE